MDLKHSRERGQILVFMVVGIVGLLGFAALAIDGGMIFSDRRYDQSVADASALAAAGAIADYYHDHQVKNQNFNCSDAKVSAARLSGYPAAQARAQTNGFTIAANPSQDNLTNQLGVNITCSNTTKAMTVRVLISSEVTTSFAHMFYSGTIRNTVEAVSVVYAPKDLGDGRTVVGLSQTCSNSNDRGLVFDGASQVSIHHGGIHSNGCIIGNGGVSVNITGPNTYSTSFNNNPGISPPPTQTSMKVETATIPPPNCNWTDTNDPNNSMGNFGSVTVGNNTVIQQGNYTSITANNKTDVLIMKPGLYCLNGDFSINGGTIWADGVTVYMKKKSNGQSSNFSIGGNAGASTSNTELLSIRMTAPKWDSAGKLCVTSNCPPSLPGMLIFMAPGNNGNITLQGTADSQFAGTVYAPNGTVDLGGNSNFETNMGVQAVADTVKIHGTVTMNVFTFDDQVYMNYPYLSLKK